MYAPNLATPPAVIDRLVGLLDRWQVERFIDAGCGDGDVLVAAARARPGRRCLGLEADPDLAERARRRCTAMGLADVHVVCADVLRRPSLLAEADCIYAFLGGATHQALGRRLTEQRMRARLVTALHPAIGLPAVGRTRTGPLELYWYDPAMAGGRVTWDSPLSIAMPRAGGAQLSCRLATVYSFGHLTAQLRGQLPEGLEMEVQLGSSFADSGQAVVIDLLLRACPSRPVVPTAIELILAIDGRPLGPAHVLVVGATESRCLDVRAPFTRMDDREALALAHRQPARLVDLVCASDARVALSPGAPVVRSVGEQAPIAIG